MSMQDKEIIASVLAGSGIREGFGKVYGRPAKLLWLIVRVAYKS